MSVKLFHRRTPEPPAKSVEIDGRRRSYVTLPGYGKGRKPANAGNTYPIEVLTTGEMLRLLAACLPGYAGDRDRALFTVLWRCGLRIAEALALMPKDVDLEHGTITVLRGKGGKRRTVGIDERAAGEVAHWLERRADLGVTSQQPVFCVISRPTVGRGLYSSCVRESLRDTARRAGIEKRVAPHVLRHTFAVNLAEEGVPINIISALLGHSNSGTTARYIDHLYPGQAINVARARVWGDG